MFFQTGGRFHPIYSVILPQNSLFKQELLSFIQIKLLTYLNITASKLGNNLISYRYYILYFLKEHTIYLTRLLQDSFKVFIRQFGKCNIYISNLYIENSFITTTVFFLEKEQAKYLLQINVVNSISTSYTLQLIDSFIIYKS